MPKEEGPTIRKVYELYGASQNFEVVQFNYQHNYNVESREAMYDFFVRHLGNGPKGAQEVPITLQPNQLRVKRPGGATGEALMASLRTDADSRERRFVSVAVVSLVRFCGMVWLLPGNCPSERPPRGKSVLLVCVERDSAAAEWASALTGQGLTVNTLALPADSDKPRGALARLLLYLQSEPAWRARGSDSGGQ
ncbi:MAG: hypothetical protein QM758_15295 [Armatimonas sp.]